MQMIAILIMYITELFYNIYFYVYIINMCTFLLHYMLMKMTSFPGKRWIHFILSIH